MAEKEIVSSKGAIPVNENAKYDKNQDLKAISYDKGLDKNKNNVVDIEMGVFFDGTLNNMYNTDKTTGGPRDMTSQQKYRLDAEGERAFNKKRDAERAEMLSKIEGDSSYGNDNTNVVRLFKYYEPKPQKGDKLYVEGQGTTAGKEDDTAGKAYGAGDSGIVGRVEKACKDAADKIAALVEKHPKKNEITNKKTGNKVIDILIFDVFGFSRGAAAARHFVHEINKPASQTYIPGPTGTSGSSIELPSFGKLGVQLKSKKIEVRHLVIRLLGIYDTVSSYENFKSSVATGTGVGITRGPVGAIVGAIGGTAKAGLNPNFSNDVKELKLDDIGMSKKMVHFTAGDEHREHFSLTTARSNNDGKAKELQFVEKMLPGAHSDVGGSYVDNMNEKAFINATLSKKASLSGITQRVITKNRDVSKKDLDLEKQQLIRDGWYKEKQIEVKEMSDETHGKYQLRGTRTLSNKYSFIPLQFMHEIALESQVPFKDGIKDEYSIKGHSILTQVEAKLRCVVFDGESAFLFDKLKPRKYGKGNAYSDESDIDLYKNLRNEYLHWSAVLDMGKTPRINDDSPRVNEQGKREREIFTTKPSIIKPPGGG